MMKGLHCPGLYVGSGRAPCKDQGMPTDNEHAKGYLGTHVHALMESCPMQHLANATVHDFDRGDHGLLHAHCPIRFLFTAPLALGS